MPKGKAASAGPSQDKMMELMLSSMSSFSEKLAAMEERISSLADKPQESVQESHPCKSCSREKSKKREPSEDRLDTVASNLVQTDTGVTYAKVFPDTAVVLKHAATPARNKKMKNDLDHSRENSFHLHLSHVLDLHHCQGSHLPSRDPSLPLPFITSGSKLQVTCNIKQTLNC